MRQEELIVSLMTGLSVFMPPRS